MSPPQDVDLTEVASHAVFVGSPEHKSTPSFAGQATPRSDASMCDPALKGQQRKLTCALRKAILNGQIGELWEGEFPRYVWCRVDGTICEARLSNRAKGEYKGYPLEDDEMDGLTL